MSRAKMPRLALPILCLAMFVLPTVLATVPVSSTEESGEEGWWVETTVDRDGNGIGDMIELHQHNPLFLDEDKTLPLIVDFSFTPGTSEIQMLEEAVDYRHQWTLKGINALAGRVPVGDILTASQLPGVVMLELDGILTVTNGDAAALHGVDTAWEQTGYNGSGITVAIIDTGIDGNHSGLDDQDDDPSTNDPKIIGFYDPVNNPDLRNGTEVFPYDDQGHGSHCAGTTAGTGAPNYDHPGMAPKASLVGVKVLDSGGSGSFGTVMAGMEWTVEKRYDFNIRAASMSLGGPGAIEWTSSEEDSVNRYANKMMSQGIALFIAAGNNAVSAQIGTPGSAEDAITVGALDKDSSIAIYSSQGPTEEGRVKPNIAFVGSDVMSVAHNTGDGYVAFSGTSMATPGAAGVAALMLQANPDLSPFDVRNIMQETATYRQCHYMFANEPCVEDLIPKNRQNNVYGHGEVRALDALLEAAQYHFDFNSNLSVTLSTPTTLDNRIHLRDWDSIVFDVSENTETVRWRSNGLETPWTTLHGYEPGDSSAEISVISIIHYLEHESVEIIGNHTIMIRGILDEDGANPQSSPIITAEIMVMTDDKSPPMPVDEDGFSTYAVIGFSIGGIILFLIVLLLVSTLSTREEGSLSGKQLRSYLDAQIVDAVDADLSDNPFWEEKA
ncbi:MAG: S8 family serine peptidase [Candidatus Thermoplasmatota archaeon]|nr:S8 family serine peptidase [Candidatus Thermoplasmatota archaeon]MEC7254225.1 S8 family serine peptidase [Candidatus Thermoplasmatota archaeon]